MDTDHALLKAGADPTWAESAPGSRTVGAAKKWRLGYTDNKIEKVIFVSYFGHL